MNMRRKVSWPNAYCAETAETLTIYKTIDIDIASDDSGIEAKIDKTAIYSSHSVSGVGEPGFFVASDKNSAQQQQLAFPIYRYTV